MSGRGLGGPMKTHVVAEQALSALIDDYKTGLPPTTYTELAQRCGIEGNVRWFGQVTDIIDAACALAEVPSFALVRVLAADHQINHAAWRKQYSYLRDIIIDNAKKASWTDEDFRKIAEALIALAVGMVQACSA